MMEQLPDAVKKDIAKELKGKKMRISRPKSGPRSWPRSAKRCRRAVLAAAAAVAAMADRRRPVAVRRLTPVKWTVRNAKLPPPPEEDSQLDVLLRPGMLARRGDHRREDP